MGERDDPSIHSGAPFPGPNSEARGCTRTPPRPPEAKRGCPSQIEQLGITYHELRRLVNRGKVEHVARGLYRLADVEPTEHYTLGAVCARVPESIICLLSALSVHEIGTQLPHQVWLAIPHKADPPRVPGIKVRLLRFSGAAWSLGVETTAFEGVPARITSPARTIVDCFRFERLVGREAALEVMAP